MVSQEIVPLATLTSQKLICRTGVGDAMHVRKAKGNVVRFVKRAASPLAFLDHLNFPLRKGQLPGTTGHY